MESGGGYGNSAASGGGGGGRMVVGDHMSFEGGMTPAYGSRSFSQLNDMFQGGEHDEE